MARRTIVQKSSSNFQLRTDLELAARRELRHRPLLSHANVLREPFNFCGGFARRRQVVKLQQRRRVSNSIPPIISQLAEPGRKPFGQKPISIPHGAKRVGIAGSTGVDRTSTCNHIPRFFKKTILNVVVLLSCT